MSPSKGHTPLRAALGNKVSPSRDTIASRPALLSRSATKQALCPRNTLNLVLDSRW